MEIIQVSSKKTKKLFNKIPELIYKGDINFACPLITMVEENFDPIKNTFFKHGKAIRWVAIDDRSKPIGRIAAFIDTDKAYTFSQPTGNIGFFECINDQVVADALFNKAKEWLIENGMEAMDGPSNMGENYMNHGLLVNGFIPQGYGMPYNKPYYLELFEKYGFKTYYEQYCYHLDYTKPFPERFWKIAEWVAKKNQYSFSHFTWKDSEKYIDDFCKIYEGAWSKHEHFKPLDKGELTTFINSSKLLLDPEFIWFAYCDDEPIALFVMVPDFNQALRYIKNGKLTPWNIIRLLYFIKRQKFTRTRIFIMGVSEKYQKSGIESGIFWNLENKVMKFRKNYKEIELSWAGDFNPKIVSLYKSTGAKHCKTHYQMRYIFDRKKPFERSKVIE
ncbi:MAG: GNAT family N-acetyltransferase [Prolixibacteraceae bacterium]|nr:GNAT family N-acetyltransferase [Prolixibacteraceae bacterium]